MNDLNVFSSRCSQSPGKLILPEFCHDTHTALLRLVLDFSPVIFCLDKCDIIEQSVFFIVDRSTLFSFFRNFRVTGVRTIFEFSSNLCRIVIQRLHVCVVIIAIRLLGNGRDLQLNAGRDGILVLQMRSDGDVIVLVNIGSKPLLRKHKEKLRIFCDLRPVLPVRGEGVDLLLDLHGPLGIVRGGPGSVGAGAVIRNLQFDLLRGSCFPDLTDALSVRRRIEVAEGGPVHVKETAADHDIVHRGIFRIIQDKRLPEAGQLDVCIASLQRFAELVHVRNRRDKGLLRHVVKDHSVKDVPVLVDLVLGIGPGRRSFRSSFAGR